MYYYQVIVKGIEPEYTFESNTDLVFTNSEKKKYLYDTAPKYNLFRGSSVGAQIDIDYIETGYTNNPINIISGRIIPEIQFNNELSYLDDYNDLLKNTCLLDIDYDKNINQIGSLNTFGKYKSQRYDIVGNNSNLYNKSPADTKDNSELKNVYAEVLNVIESGNQQTNNDITGYIITSYDISLEKMILIYTKFRKVILYRY